MCYYCFFFCFFFFFERPTAKKKILFFLKGEKGREGGPLPPTVRGSPSRGGREGGERGTEEREERRGPAKCTPVQLAPPPSPIRDLD